MMRLFLCFISLILVTACSGKKGIISSDVKIISTSNLIKSAGAQSDMIIYGEDDQGRSFSKKISSNSHTIELPVGVWNLYAIYWENTESAKFTGQIQCGKQEGVNLNQSIDKINIELIINNEKCNDASFSHLITQNEAQKYQFPIFNIYMCQDTSLVENFSQGESSCSEGENKGPATSYKINFYDYINFDSSNSSRTLAISSRCYTMPRIEVSDEILPRIPVNMPLGAMSVQLFYGQEECHDFDGSTEINLDINTNLSKSAPDKSQILFFTQSNPNRLYNPKDVDLGNAEKNSLTLTWKSSGTKTQGYRITYAKSPNTPSIGCTSSSGINLNKNIISKTITNLDVESEYIFRICAFDENQRTSSGFITVGQTDPRSRILSINRLDPDQATGNQIIDKNLGESIVFGVNFDTQVKFIYSAPAKPRIQILLGSQSVYATILTPSGVSNSTHQFEYVPGFGDYLPNETLMVFDEEIDLNGASTLDETGNNPINTSATGKYSAGTIKSKVFSCPDGYIHVPPNPAVGTTHPFCVMAIEARNDGSGSPTVSDPRVTPWKSVDANVALDKCDGIGGAVMSNAEWMTIARNVENVADNWKSDAVAIPSVGVGQMYIGHTDSTLGTLSLNDSTDPYDLTGKNAGLLMGGGAEQRRTLTLSNGETIWDFAGNLSEWVDWTIADEDGDESEDSFDPFVPENGNCSTGLVGSAGEVDWDTVVGYDCGLTQNLIGPSNDNFNSGDGIGKLNGYVEEGTGYAIRGGHTGIGDFGIYYLFLDNSETALAYVGFRCVLRQ